MFLPFKDVKFHLLLHCIHFSVHIKSFKHLKCNLSAVCKEFDPTLKHYLNRHYLNKKSSNKVVEMLYIRINPNTEKYT